MAKTGKFTCSACGRTFLMAAHLARHRNTMHAAWKGKKTARKAAAGWRVGRATPAVTRRRPAPGPGIAGVVGQLCAYRDTLAAERAHVESQLAAVDGVLSALGVTAAVARVTGGRGALSARGGSLKDFIGRALRARKGPMAVQDITAAVRVAGYQSKNKTLPHSVGLAVREMSGVVKVGRGQFRLRGRSHTTGVRWGGGRGYLRNPDQGGTLPRLANR